MSQQINLLNPALRKIRDWLVAAPIASFFGVLLAIVAGAAMLSKTQADHVEQAAERQTTSLKLAQEKLTALAKVAAQTKPNPQIATELASARELLKGREEVMRLLEGGMIGSTGGFAEYLRGFARQTTEGLWLTGFTIGAGGEEMEIRGRMTNPAALSEYIRRLNHERVFQGRSFAALNIRRTEEGTVRKDAAAAPSAKSPALPAYVEFVLTPSISAPAAAAGEATSGTVPAEVKKS